jgi:hypothetical protein
MGTINITLVAGILALAAPAYMAARDRDASAPSGAKAGMKDGYAPVNGLRMYYEIHGDARPGVPPLVLLHGGGSRIETTFGRILPSLAKTRQVIAVEEQGHGRTSASPTERLLRRRSAAQTDGATLWTRTSSRCHGSN